MELQNCLISVTFTPQKVNYWRRNEFIVFYKGFKDDLSETDQSQ